MAGVARIDRPWLAALLLVASLHGHAAATADPAGVDAIERAGSEGDAARALRLSAELLANTENATSAARIAAIQARIDALVDTGEWARHSEALRAAIAALPDTPARAAIEISFAANAAASPGMQAALLEAANRGIERNFLQPDTFLAEMHGAAGRALLAQGKHDAACAEGRLALDAWQRRAGVRARRYEANVEQLLAQCEQQRGHADLGLEHAARAVDLAAATFGPASLIGARATEQRAAILEALDRFPEARQVREQLLKITRERYGGADLRTAQAEGALGAHLQRTGNYVPARQHYTNAEAIMAGLVNVGARDRLVLANNFANLLQEMGDEDAALEHYRAAFVLAADERTRAIILTNIGNTEFRLQRYEQAIADFNQALPLREKAEGTDSPGLSFALEGLGSSALALKRYADAERYFARAAELRGRNSAPNHSQLNVLNFGLALARWGEGRDADAFALAVQTAQRQQSLLSALASGFSEQQSVAFDRLLVPATPLAVTIAADHADAREIATAWQLVMNERGLIARAEARRLALARASADPQLVLRQKQWRAANAALGDAWVSSKTTPAQMSELQAAAEAAERELWSRLGLHAENVGSAAAPIDAMAAALPRDGALIAFTEGVSRNAARIVNAGDVQSAEDLYAFVLRPDGAAKLLRVGRSEALFAQSRAWYGALRDPHSDEALLRRHGDALRHDLFDPIGVGAQKLTLFVVPLGELYRVNFAALPGADGGYLLDAGLRAHTLAHESDLLLPATDVAASRIVLAGAPLFASTKEPVVPAQDRAVRQLCAAVAERGFAPIPGAERELEGLRGVLRSALGDAADVSLIDGAAATKERVLAAIDGAAVVHLATHGFSVDETCGATSATRGVVLDRERVAPVADVMPLSGLAFSGADVGSGHAPVGVLSAGELSAVDLSHAAWVVLSSCDSGLGPIGHTEGVFGMRRALRLAGARTVVMSLWEVDDAATSDLMQALYVARFARHRDVPDAMAEAMRTLLDARRAAHASTHPYYWAAFVGEGGWR